MPSVPEPEPYPQECRYHKPRSQSRRGDASRLLNDLVRPPQQRRWDRQPERPGGLEIDDQLELRRLLDGQIGWLGPPEDLVHVRRGTPLHLRSIYSIGHETPWLYKYLELIDC